MVVRRLRPCSRSWIRSRRYEASRCCGFWMSAQPLCTRSPHNSQNDNALYCTYWVTTLTQLISPISSRPWLNDCLYNNFSHISIHYHKTIVLGQNEPTYLTLGRASTLSARYVPTPLKTAVRTGVNWERYYGWLGCHIISVCQRLYLQTSVSLFQENQQHTTSTIVTVCTALTYYCLQLWTCCLLC